MSKLYTTGPIYPCNPATTRSESTKLGVDPKGEKLVYTNGRAVIIRDINNGALAHAYTQHTQTATVARFSPSGYYVASGDVGGNVRIWDVTNPETNILKRESRPLSGRVNDLAWDGESKRLVVGGEGKDTFGAAYFVDSGSSCGQVSGHGKPINAISMRHQRPFRVVSGSDDNTIVYYTAVPVKFDKLISTHTRFVRDVGFSPNGDVFASVGSDGKLFLYDGKTGDVQADADAPDPTRSLIALSWAPDSTQLVTAGADGVVALWDAAAAKVSQTYNLGSDVQDQQNGVVWASPNTIVSVSLSGDLNVFDTRDSKSRKLYGPTKAVTAAALNEADKTFYTGSFDGGVKAFAVDGGECSNVTGAGHTARVVGMAPDGKGKVWSAGWDDKVASIEGDSFGATSIPTKTQPTSIAATASATYVATPAGLEIISGGQTSIHPGEYTAVTAITSTNGDLVAFGSGKKVTLATVSNGKVSTEAEFEDNKGDVLALAFSPDATYLAAGDAAGRIILIDVGKKIVTVSSRWTFHTGRISSLAFSPDSRRLVSGGADESIYIWNPAQITRRTPITNAHAGGVSAVAWSSQTGIISSGADGCVRTWEVPE